MREHKWRPKRDFVMPEEGTLRAEKCIKCGALRLALWPWGSNEIQIFTTDPETLPEECPGRESEYVSTQRQPKDRTAR